VAAKLARMVKNIVSPSSRASSDVSKLFPVVGLDRLCRKPDGLPARMSLPRWADCPILSVSCPLQKFPPSRYHPRLCWGLAVQNPRHRKLAQTISQRSGPSFSGIIRWEKVEKRTSLTDCAKSARSAVLPSQELDDVRLRLRLRLRLPLRLCQQRATRSLLKRKAHQEQVLSILSSLNASVV
jgi:hypothetical protein